MFKTIPYKSNPNPWHSSWLEFVQQKLHEFRKHQHLLTLVQPESKLQNYKKKKKKENRKLS